MKRLAFLLLAFQLIVTADVNAQTCNAFMQYTLGACPNVLIFDGSTSSPGTITSWFYDFGDGSTSTMQNPSHVYATNGNYLACLTITTSDGCTSSYCDTIPIGCYAAPICNAAFSYTLGACPAISFFDASTSSPGTITSWAYDFGDGGTSSSQNPTHTYTANGSYITCLTIGTSDGCTSTYCDTITISCITAPSCSALFQYTLGLCPNIMFFDGSTSSPGTITSWAYDFGEGSSSTNQNPAHVYTANGTYLVCLTIGTSDGCTSTFCDTLNISCITPPTCNAAYSYTLGVCPQVDFFDASTSSPGTITSWFYDFGDGGSSASQNPSHTYTANGSYVVCSTIGTSDGCTSTYCDTITISCIGASACDALFSHTLGACPQVDFTDLSTASSGVTSWYYDFGDGGTSTSQNPSHTYTANGTYVVCLWVGAADSCGSSYCDTITVSCIGASTCDAAFSYTLGGCPAVTFIDASTSAPGSIVSWSYDFGDGASSTTQSPTHTYAANGSYLVCLTILTSDSCTSTYCDTIVINCISAGVCNAACSYTLGACPEFTFIDASTSSPGSISSWMYDFGDGSSSTVQSPIHTYSTNGIYLVCLTISTTDGCTSTYCDTLDVNCLVGINEIDPGLIRLHPNPASESFALQLENSAKIAFRIVATDGRIVQEGERNESDKHLFDISELTIGSYQLEVSMNGSKTVLKFIKE